MIVVVDASVAMKWFLADSPEEPDAHIALGILQDSVAGALRLWQPPNFIPEMAAMLTRLKPHEALLDVRDLQQIETERIEDPAVYVRAIELALTLDHHLFDTLYHAVALSEPGATLVTADRRYYRKARDVGAVALLANWRQPHGA
jgi:predicted nucleic acid-binding protein